MVAIERGGGRSHGNEKMGGGGGGKNHAMGAFRISQSYIKLSDIPIQIAVVEYLKMTEQS